MADIGDVINTAKTIKESLIASWEENQCFVDKDRMDDPGIMAESIGLTTLLLLGISFKDAEGFWEDGDVARFNAITNRSLNFICDEVESKGFTAEPLVSADRTKAFFNSDVGYTDTVTWVLSTMILIRYSHRKNIIGLVKDDQDRVFRMISKTLKVLVEGQHPNGTWGFITDKGSKDALYYTYASSVTLGDFFDYVAGEIADVEGEGTTGFDHRDSELIDYLNHEFECDDVVKMMDQVRKKTGRWLIDVCLPSLPILSECINIDSPEERDSIGIWGQNADLTGDYYKGVNFINLYYVYYLIDMMTITYSDEVFQELVSTSEGLDELSRTYKNKLPSLEHFYFFDNSAPDTLYDSLYKGYMEQAIHSARNNFMIASRTGNSFWDSVKSELVLKWEHNDTALNSQVINALTDRRGEIQITEPALLPMALRANTCFCYYISNQRDYSLSRLYSMIVSSMATETDRACIAGTWDRISFNLAVTERSVEAMVDYYDYLCKFESDEPQVITVSSDVAESEIESVLEKLIDKRISLALGSASTDMNAGPSGECSDQASFNSMADEYLRHLIARIRGIGDIYDANVPGDLLFEILMAHKALDNDLVLMATKDQQESEGQDYNPNEAQEQLIAYQLRKAKLIRRLMQDTSDSTADFVSMYERVRMK